MKNQHDIRTSGAKGKMQARPDAPAGIEQDGLGHVIPFAQRTPEHQLEALKESKRPLRVTKTQA